jgi:hypothetical protein
MEITSTPALERNPALAALARQANETLREVVNDPDAVTEAEWTVSFQGKEESRLALRLSDFTGSTVETELTPGDFQDSGRLWHRLRQAWGRLLRERTEKQLQEFLSDTAVREGV